MATLPTRDNLGPLPTARGGGGIARVQMPSASAGAAIGQGVANIGAGLSQVAVAADHIEGYNRKKEEFETERGFQEFEWNQRQALDQSMRDIQPGQADGFQNNWQQTYVKSAGEFFKNIPDHLKPKYEEKLFQAEQNLYGAATTFARGEQKRFSVNSVNDAVENIYRPRARVSTTDEIATVTSDHDQLIDANPNLTPVEKDELKRKGRRAIGLSHIDALPPEQVRTLATSRGRPVDTSPEGLLRKFEGFQEGAYWDVNAYRVGYGSDTVTRADGTIEKVTPQTRVTREDAERDLARRSKEFAATASRQVGQDKWEAMPPNVKAALTSVAYNYGSLPKSVVAAVGTGDANAIANSVRSLSANRSRRAQEADVILGGGGQPTALAALTDEDWQRAESQAATRQSRQAVQVAETFERHILDAGAGRGALPDRASIELDPSLDDQRRNTVLRQYDAVAKDVVGTQNFIDRLNGGTAAFNPYDAKEKQYADAAYNRLGGDGPALQLIASKTGIVPKSAATNIRADINSTSPDRVASGLTTANNLIANNPNIFSAVDGRGEIEKAAVSYRHFVEDLGFTSEEAARRIVEFNSPEYKAKVTGKIKSEDLNEIVKKNVKVEDIGSAFDTSFLGLGRNPQVAFEPETRMSMFKDYEELFRENYLSTGDISLSKSLATNQLKKVWGVSNVSGSSVVMRYPPERAPAFARIENASELIAADAVQSIKDETGQAVERDKIRLLPVPGGRTSQAYWAGQPPPYLLGWQDKNGLVHFLNPGRAYVADPKVMLIAQSDRRARQTMDAQVMAADAAPRQNRRTGRLTMDNFPSPDGNASLPELGAE